MDLKVLEDVLSQRAQVDLRRAELSESTGVTMDAGARGACLDSRRGIAFQSWKMNIYRELRYDGADIPPLKSLDEHGVVIYISSFSKVGFPDCG